MGFNDSKLDIPKSAIKALLSNVPFVGSVVCEIISYFDSKYINERLESLEIAINEQNIILDDFKKQLNSLNEHQYYVARNSLKSICTVLIPETVDAFNRALINFIMDKDRSISEECCEIISQLNTNDVGVIKRLKRCINLNKTSVKNFNNQVENKKSKTNIVNNTVLWESFAVKGENGEVLPFNTYVNGPFSHEGSDKLLYDLAFQSRAIYKLQSLGVLQIISPNTVGDTQNNNIDSIQVTFIGLKIMEYIKDRR